MTFDELSELHNITPLANLGSILSVGVLSHDAAKRTKHTSIAMPEIQDRREVVVLPNGRRLHSYANLYFNARNAMMYKRRLGHRELCVVRIDKQVLLLPGVVVADQNAAKSYVRFSKGADGLRRLNATEIFARSWVHSGDTIATCRHRAAMCAEVLVCDRVPPEFITGVYVSCVESRDQVMGEHRDVDVIVNQDLFFQ